MHCWCSVWTDVLKWEYKENASLVGFIIYTSEKLSAGVLLVHPPSCCRRLPWLVALAGCSWHMSQASSELWHCVLFHCRLPAYSIGMQGKGWDSPSKPVNLAPSCLLPDFDDAMPGFLCIYCECWCINKEQCSFYSFACSYFLFLRKSQSGFKKVKIKTP